MELVSERSEKDIAAELALAGVDDALRRLAANVKRITAGAGKSYDLMREMGAFVSACMAYDDATGRTFRPIPRGTLVRTFTKMHVRSGRARAIFSARIANSTGASPAVDRPRPLPRRR